MPCWLRPGRPALVIPTLYARIGDHIYLHGSPLSRMLRCLEISIAVCVTVTFIDGIVLARAAFSSSVNYRSVVILDRGQVVSDVEDKKAALRALVDHVVARRSDDARGPNAKELATTTVVAIPLDGASAKARTGPPKDTADDHALDVWAGELPLSLRMGEPVADAALPAHIPVPDYIRHLHRPPRFGDS